MPWVVRADDTAPPLLPMYLDERDRGHTPAIAAFFAVDDRARFDEVDGCLCVQLTSATFDPADRAPRRHIIQARLTTGGVLMRRFGDGADTSPIDTAVERQWRHLPDGQRDASVLLMIVVNAVIGDHQAVLDEIRRRVEQLDEALLASNPPLNRILSQLRRVAAHLGAVRDGLIPMRAQMREVQELRDPVERRLVSPAGARWLANIVRDLQDEVPSSLAAVERRVATTTENLHGERSESTNRIVALLTVVTAALFVPTLVTGLYGMNVPLPGQRHTWVFWIAIGLTTVLLAVGLVMITKMGLWGTFRRLLPTARDLLPGMKTRPADEDDTA